MKVVGVIPARYGSTRLEGKVLIPLAGKPMIWHVWNRASKAKCLSDVIIACDDKRVFDVAEDFGANVVMTDVDLVSGTDRVSQAMINIDADVVVNIQGDEPLIDPKVIDKLADVFVKDENALMATVIKSISKDIEINNPNVVKVVVDQDGNALYFSRSPIPFDRSQQYKKYYKHLGLYAYKKDFLSDFTKLKPSPLELAEKLEQLRVLENGYAIKTVVTDVETIGVDTKEDVEVVEKILNGR